MAAQRTTQAMAATTFIADVLHASQTVTLAGGIICPATPSFYSRPQSLDEAAMTVVNRVIDLIGLENESYRWSENSEQ